MRIRTAYVFHGHLGIPGGAWCHTVVGADADDLRLDRDPRSGRLSPAKCLRALEADDTDPSRSLRVPLIKDEDARRKIFSGDEFDAYVEEYPVLVADDGRTFALAPFEPDMLGRFPPQPVPPDRE